MASLCNFKKLSLYIYVSWSPVHLNEIKLRVAEMASFEMCDKSGSDQEKKLVSIVEK